MDDARHNPPPGGLDATLTGDVPLPALQLGAKFEVLRELGRGAMGAVYEVRHRELDRRMAVKVMSVGAGARDRLIRFRREAQVVSELQHPNVLRVFDLDRTTSGRLFIVMELLEGEDLKERLRRNGALPPALALQIGDDLASALDAVHAADVVHRDVKPANVFLTDGGAAKLVDFGVCHMREGPERLTSAGGAVGTLLYMSPEQLRGEEPTGRSDVYGLACVMWEMLAGRSPFHGLSLQSLLAIGERSDTLQRTRGRVPEAAAAVLERGMADDPADRYETAGKLLEALRESLSCPRIEAPRPADTGRPGPSTWRGRRRTAWLTLALALGCLAAAGLFFLPPSPSPAPDGPAAGGEETVLASPGGQAERSPPPEPPATAAAFPAHPRLLALPFESAPERPLDEDLWPLTERLILNALEPDDVVADRLERVDPLAVEEQIRVRGLGPTLDREEALELAALNRADLVLEGRVSRERGHIVLRARLWTPTGAEREIQAQAPRLLETVQALTARLRETLWPDGPPPPAPERAAALLQGTPDSVAMLEKVTPFTPARERRVVYQQIAQQDPLAIGAQWRLVLEDIVDGTERSHLAQMAAALPSGPVRQAFTTLSQPVVSPEDCAAAQLDELGARYPESVGQLAAAVCHYRSGDLKRAELAALAAFEDPRTRYASAELLALTMVPNRSCKDHQTVLRSGARVWPESPNRWLALATNLARCGPTNSWKRALAAAQAQLPVDPRTRRRIAREAVLLPLLQHDVEGARPWMEILRRAWSTEEPHPNEAFVASLFAVSEGRWSDGVHVLEDTLRKRLDRSGQPDDYDSMLLASLFYKYLARGRVEDAAALSRRFSELYPNPKDVGNTYMGKVLALATERARGELDAAAAHQRLSALGAAVEQSLGALGRSERAAQECMYLTALGTKAEAAHVLDWAPEGLILLGGCRVRRAQLLAEANRWREAAAEFDRAANDIVQGRFLFVEELAGALLGRADALAAAGDTTRAREIYERIVGNYSYADHEMPERVAAERALKQLAP